MGGGGSKPIENAFCENDSHIISELNNIECFSNGNKKELIYVCIIFIILLIISIHFLHRRR
tara:strand:+ start:469 stop:651 length:183 start_codon:yes stop_codon:yes gene_type:complete